MDTRAVPSTPTETHPVCERIRVMNIEAGRSKLHLLSGRWDENPVRPRQASDCWVRTRAVPPQLSNSSNCASSLNQRGRPRSLDGDQIGTLHGKRQLFRWVEDHLRNLSDLGNIEAVPIWQPFERLFPVRLVNRHVKRVVLCGSYCSTQLRGVP